MNPLIRFALDHPEQAPLYHLKRISLEVGEDEEQPIFRRRQGAVFVHGKPARGPRLPIHPPRRHTGVERGLEGRDQLLKLVEGQAGKIQGGVSNVDIDGNNALQIKGYRSRHLHVCSTTRQVFQLLDVPVPE